MTDPQLPPDDAMREFTREAPGLLNQVLGQLRDQSRRLREMGMGGNVPEVPLFDLSGLDPHAPGAYGPLNAASGATPPLPPISPAQPGAPAAQPGAPAADPAPPAGQAADPVATATAAAVAEEAAVEEEPKSLEELLAELDELIGLGKVKEEIHRQSAILRVQALRSKAGLKDPTITRHLVFVGNPGTGKTTVARLVGGIYRALGLLSKGQLVEVDRSELVAGYLGQTAIKTAEVCASAMGGVLFIDEAYSLSGDQYGEEAINTLVKEMEDNRGDLVVIVAGYPAPMATFISENPGLASRFRTTIFFADYTDEELIGMLYSMAAKADYDLSEATVDAFKLGLAHQLRDETFGNGRYVRNCFEAAIGKQAWRLRDIEEPTKEQLRELAPEDMAPDSEEPAVDWQPVPGQAEATPDTNRGSDEPDWAESAESNTPPPDSRPLSQPSDPPVGQPPSPPPADPPVGQPTVPEGEPPVAEAR